MYAIISVGGKQYWVKQNDIIEVEKQPVEKDKEFVVKDVLFLSKDNGEIEVGRPFLNNVKVTAKSLGETRTKKVITYKYRRRKASSHTKKGHRQTITRVLIKEIQLN